MNLFDLARIVNSDMEAEEYLEKVGILKTFDQCIHCGSTQILKVRRRNIKCYSCKREWSSKKFSVLEDIRVSPGKFLLVVKCFALKLPINTCADECNLDFVTVKKIYDLIRERLTPAFRTIQKDRSEVELIICYDELTLKFSVSLRESTDSKDIIADMLLRRIRRLDSNYTYQIRIWRAEGELPSSILGKVSILIKQIKTQLATVSDRSTAVSLLTIGEVVFRFNSNSNELFEKTLDIIAQNVGG